MVSLSNETAQKNGKVIGASHGNNNYPLSDHNFQSSTVDFNEARLANSNNTSNGQHTPTENAYHEACETVGCVVGKANVPSNYEINHMLTGIPGVCRDPKVVTVDNNIDNFKVKLKEDLPCRLIIDNRVVNFTIPKGFETDLASIPRGLSRFLPPWGDYSTAAIIHDYMYEHAPCGVTRFQTDTTFYDCMKKSNVGFVARWLITGAVMLFGGAPWNRYRESERQTRYAIA